MPYIIRLIYIIMISLPFAANSEESNNIAPNLKRELHVVSIPEGNHETKGRIHGPETRVIVDRPDVSVTLVLTSKRPVRWYISTSKGTTVDVINLFGKEAERSEVLLNDSPYKVDNLYQLIEPAYKTNRQGVRELIYDISTITGHDYFDNYIERLGDGPIIIDQSNINTLRAELACTYYKSDLAYRRMIPAQFKDDMFTFRHINFGKHFLTGNRIGGKHLQLIPKPKARVIFSSEGFHMNGVDYPVSLDVPEIQHVPVGSAYDEKRNLLYGINGNGDGYFYKFDLDTKKWSTINGSSNMRGLSPIGMLFDTAADRLLMPVWYPIGSNEQLVIIQQSFNSVSKRIGFDRAAFEGLDDLSRDGVSVAPHITPVGVMGNTIILLASPWDLNAYDSKHSYKDGLCGWTRLYFADMTTGEVALVQHENRPDLINTK